MRVRLWAVVTAVASAVLLLSLALPWAREWTGRRTAGAAVLFVADDYRPHLGVVLLVLWGAAVAGAARGTRAWWWLAVMAAVGAVAICPVYYATAIAGDRGIAIGQDATGNTVEWAVRGELMAGIYVAAVATVSLCTGVLIRGRSLARPAA